MKMKIGFLVVLLLVTVIFSGCTKKDSTKADLSEEAINKIKKESQESIDSSLKGEDAGLIGEVANNTIKRALNNKKSIHCNWLIELPEVIEDADIDNENEDLAGGAEEGDFYLTDDKFRYTVKITENSKETVVDILNNGKNIYQWSSLVDQGTKIGVKEAQSMGMIDYDREYEWICSDWEVNEAVFLIPANIKFIDLERM